MGGSPCVSSGSVFGSTPHQPVNTLEQIPQGRPSPGNVRVGEAKGQCMMGSLVPVDVPTASRFGSILREISGTSQKALGDSSR